MTPVLVDTGSLVAVLAERDQFATVFTLDHRHFSVYRLAGNRSLRLLPEHL